MHTFLESDKLITCCFTGHRPSKLPWKYNEQDPACLRLKTRIFDVTESMYRSGYTHFICGMAQGCDTYFCEAVIELRSQHPNVTIEAAIPCEEQCKKWPESQRNRYYKLVSECDYSTLIQTVYTPDCMIKRNKYMVDRSSAIIAVYDGTLGGTMQTIAYAAKNNLQILELQP